MALISERSLRNEADVLRKSEGYRRTASRVLVEESMAFSEAATYDIFLSHSTMDADIILGLKKKLNSYGYSVYVDWLEDPQLDRRNVTPKTADILRRRMKRSRSLFYAVTTNSSSSKWMPWECGFFDGFNDQVAICPIAQNDAQYGYNGQEYLGLYPYVDEEKTKGGKMQLWVQYSSDIYVSLDSWLKGEKPTKHE